MITVDQQSSRPLLEQDGNDMEKDCSFSFSSSRFETDQIISQRTLRCRHRAVTIALVISCVINIIQFAALASSYFESLSQVSLPKLYSPAQSVIQPAIRKFSPAFGLKGPAAIYVQPPSTAVDDAWKALYYTTLSITRAEAEPLLNRTIPLSAAPDSGYLTGLNVFHDLHCLDSIRKALWFGDSLVTWHSNSSSGLHHHPPDDVPDPEVLAAHSAELHDTPHLMHCINGLRESIMCHSDVTPLSWQWSPTDSDIRVYSDVAHSCRDFDRILEWGRQHATSEQIDQSGWNDKRPPEVGQCGIDDEGCGWS